MSLEVDVSTQVFPEIDSNLEQESLDTIEHALLHGDVFHIAITHTYVDHPTEYRYETTVSFEGIDAKGNKTCIATASPYALAKHFHSEYLEGLGYTNTPESWQKAFSGINLRSVQVENMPISVRTSHTASIFRTEPPLETLQTDYKHIKGKDGFHAFKRAVTEWKKPIILEISDDSDAQGAVIHYGNGVSEYMLLEHLAQGLGIKRKELLIGTKGNPDEHARSLAARCANAEFYGTQLQLYIRVNDTIVNPYIRPSTPEEIALNQQRIENRENYFPRFDAILADARMDAVIQSDGYIGDESTSEALQANEKRLIQQDIEAALLNGYIYGT